jgi:hypothetical protein
MAKVKIPKKVAGVKIPKKVRKRANKTLKFADSPVAREVAVAALGAAGLTQAARKATGGEGGRGTPDVDLEAVLEAARYAALEGLRRFFEGFEEGMAKASAAAGDDADQRPQRDKRRSSGPNSDAGGRGD